MPDSAPTQIKSGRSGNSTFILNTAGNCQIGDSNRSDPIDRPKDLSDRAVSKQYAVRLESLACDTKRKPISVFISPQKAIGSSRFGHLPRLVSIS